MPHISEKFANIGESQTVGLTGVTADLIRRGKDVITLGVGEPDFDTPAHIKEAGLRAIRDGLTKYTPADGLLELKKAIIAWLAEKNNARYAPEEIVVTNGAKHAVAQAIFAVCDPGDEVIIPTPYWVSYPEQVKLAGAVPRFLPPPDASLKITAAQLQRAISKKTRLLLLNSPCNPSGIVYNEQELQALVNVIKKSGIYVLADEVYDQIVFDGRTFVSLSSFPEIKNQLLYVNGASKSFAMTGWRIGFLAAHRDIAAVVKKYQGHTTSNASSIAQHAAIEAYLGEKDFIHDMIFAYQQRRDFVIRRFKDFDHVKCVVPHGAFYAFPDFSAYYNKEKGLNSSIEFCSYLLKEFNVAVVPGIAFGMDNHVRLSYATSMEKLQEALKRIKAGLESIANEE